METLLLGEEKLMRNLFKNFILLNALLVAIILVGCGQNENTGGETDASETKEGNTKTFKISHVTQESHVWHKTAEKFSEELEDLSDGKMNAEIYPAAQLGLEKDMIQQLETGSLDFGFLTNAYMSTRQESLNSWFMPFIFNDLEEAAKMRESDATKAMLEELSSQGLVGLDFIFAGNRHVLLNDSNVEKADDLKGQKIRIIGSPAMQDFWDDLEAGPTAMPLSEVYTSLQTGVIDGIDIDLDALVTEKYYENANYLTLTNHMTFPAVIVMGETTLNNLTDEEEEIVREAMEKAVDWGIEESIKREEENLEELIELGVEVEELEDNTSFNEVADKIKEKYANESDTIKQFLEEVSQ